MVGTDTEYTLILFNPFLIMWNHTGGALSPNVSQSRGSASTGLLELAHMASGCFKNLLMLNVKHFLTLTHSLYEIGTILFFFFFS